MAPCSKVMGSGRGCSRMMRSGRGCAQFATYDGKSDRRYEQQLPNTASSGCPTPRWPLLLLRPQYCGRVEATPNYQGKSFFDGEFPEITRVQTPWGRTAADTTQHLGRDISQFINQAHVNPRGVRNTLPDLLRGTHPNPRCRVTLGRGAVGVTTGVWKYIETQRAHGELRGNFWALQVKALPDGQCEAGWTEGRFRFTKPITSSVCAPSGALARSSSTIRCAAAAGSNCSEGNMSNAKKRTPLPTHRREANHPHASCTTNSGAQQPKGPDADKNEYNAPPVAP